MRYKTLIFDLDGTLLDTIADLAASTNFALCKHGYPEHSIDDVRRFVGNGVRKLVERALPKGVSDEEFQATFADFKEHYAEHNVVKTAPYDGIMDALNELKARGYKMAIVSNKFDGAVKSLAAHFFTGVIEVAIGETSFIHRKPAPDMVFQALKELGSNVEESLYIGDSEVDIATAKAAGMDCLSVAWGFRSEQTLVEAGASRIIRLPSELLEVLPPTSPNSL